MRNSSGTSKKLKSKTPDKPYADFPLFAHQTGRWAKKVCRKIRFYGRWGKSVAGKIVPVDDVEASAAEAKKEYDRCWPYHSQDQDAPGVGEPDHLTMLELVNQFLESKENRLQNGELSRHSFEDYHRACNRLIEHFGKTRRVDALTPADFEKLRKQYAVGCNLVSLNNKVNLARIIFKFAHDSRLIDKPVHFGQSFDKPPKMRLRENREQSEKKILERDELLTILAAFERKTKKISTASPALHAMILLGLNAGFGNSDVANLPISAVDLKSGWITFPRPKTAIKRRVPLWPETIAALRTAITERPEAASTDDADLCFLTNRGTRFVRIQASAIHENRFVVINGVLRQFDKLLSTLKVGQRKGIGFYSLRHVFETVAGGSKDQVAVDAVMGHADQTMAAHYREGIEDARLIAVVNHVRDWLWPAPVKKATAKKAR